MKTMNGKMAFGMSAVVSGQKSATLNAEPLMVACSTKGKFSITAPVSKALGIANGEYMMFFNNFGPIEAAIAEHNQDIVDFCNENGLDIESVEAHDAILNEFGSWAIAKGVLLRTKTGEARMVTERWTKEEKKDYLTKNFDELVKANEAALLEKLGVESASDEELIAAAIEAFNPTTEDYSGAKAVNVSGQNGCGIPLSCTDTAIWTALKKDLDEPTKINRTFKVCLDAPQFIDYNDGYETVSVKAYPIEFVEDAEPINRNK